jgi:3-oxoacyl-[acyl-carrier protein] reductase
VFDNSLEDFDATFAVNVRGAFVAPQAVLSDIGRLIFLSPLVAKTGGVISTPYAASKAALEGMMHHYAASLREFGVKANAIAPAFIETDNMIAGVTLPENLPMGRLGQPGEVAMVARLLLDCTYMIGETLHVNAGHYMT